MQVNDWPTGDEHWHYSYSERLLNTGQTERASVHNYNSTTPGTVLNVLSQNTYAWLTGDRSFSKFFARLPQLIWYTLLLVSSFYFARIFFGASAGWLSVTLMAVDPNLQAHAAIIGTDLPFAAVTIFFLLLLANYWNKPFVTNCAWLGLTLGLGFIAKYSGSFLVLFCLPVVFVRSFWKTPILKGLGQLSAHIAILGICSIFVVGLSYGFIGVGSSFSDREWYYKIFRYLASSIPNLPLPIPVDFISGFDHQLAAERDWDWNGIMFGQLLKSGVWYFFIVAWLIKTPVALLFVIISSILLGLKNFEALVKKPAFNLVFILFFILLIYFSFVFRVHVGLRYALMCIPLGYLLVAAFLSKLDFKPLRLGIFALLLFLSFAELKPYFGNSLAFTNLFVLPKETVYRWIADSNIDWNQNHQAARRQAQETLQNFAFNPPHILPGNNVFTVNHLAGVYRNFEKHRWVRNNLDPSAHFGFTTISFAVSENNFEKFLASERVFLPPPHAEAICSDRYKKVPLFNGQLPNLEGNWSSPSLYSACIYVSELSRIEVKVQQGRAYIGQYPREHDCQGLEVGPGESLWFVLTPGVHPVCARVVQNMLAGWVLHSGKAQRALRILAE